MSLQIWLPFTKDLRNNGASGITITNSGATVSDDGKLGKCYSFNGSSNYMKATNVTLPTTKWTMAAWICPATNSSSGHQYVVGLNTSSASDFLGVLCLYGNKLCARTAGTTYSSSVTYTLNTWYHLAAVYDGKLKIYVNGELNTTVDSPATPVSASTLYIAMRGSSGYYFNGKLNDVRIYDHAVSTAEIKEISKGLVCHYKLDTAFNINNLVRNTTYSTYNNYSSNGFTATLTNTGRTYDGCKIYRLTYTPGSDTTRLNNVRNSLANHGIMGFRRTFLANTKYCFWILCKPISHPDTIVGGTASNISGWTEKPMTKYNDDWYIVGQSRNGSVTTDKTDSIFTSFKTPSAEAEVPIIIDFCCPHLVEGYDSILPEYDYLGTDPSITDSSGYGNNGIRNGNISTSLSSPRYEMCTVFDGSSSYINITSNIFPIVLNNSFTISMWVYNSDSGDRSILFGNYGLTGSFFNIEKTNGEKVRFYWNGNPDITLSNTSLTVDAFTHLVVTCNGSTVKGYINGALTDTKSTTLNGSIPSTATNFRIGSDSRTGATMFKGRISDFRLYTTVLSDNDVLALYNVGAKVAKTGALLGYEMKEG